MEGLSRPVGGPSVRGVGLDLVDLERFREVVSRRPGVLGRIFSERELSAITGADATERSIRLAGCFAAKEAAMKAIGVGLDRVSLHDIVVRDDGGAAPSIEFEGAAADRAMVLGVRAVAVTIAETAGVVSAMVVSSG